MKNDVTFLKNSINEIVFLLEIMKKYKNQSEKAIYLMK